MEFKNFTTKNKVMLELTELAEAYEWRDLVLCIKNFAKQETTIF